MTRTYQPIGAAVALAALLSPSAAFAAPAVPLPGESLPEAPAREESPLASDMEKEEVRGGEERFVLRAILPPPPISQHRLPWRGVLWWSLRRGISARYGWTTRAA